MRNAPYMSRRQHIISFLLLAAILGAFWAIGCATDADAATTPPDPYLRSADGTIVLYETCPAGRPSCPVMGPDGVPQVRYPWGAEDNAVMVSAWGIHHWANWKVEGAAEGWDLAVRAADWHIDQQRADGGWEYLFDYNVNGVRMRAPWLSAMAQGRAMSLLVRVYRETGDQRYLDAAVRALGPFEKTVHEGGVVSDWDGHPWYEEYSGPTAQHVLNGYEFTLIGLYELAEHSDRARELWEAGLESLVAHIHEFDAPRERSQYYAALGEGRVPVTGYKIAHAWATRWLADLTGDPVLARWASAWEGYLRPVPRPAPAPAPAPKPVFPVVPPVIVEPPAPVKRYPTTRQCKRLRFGGLKAYRIRTRGVPCKRARRYIGYRLPGRFDCQYRYQRGRGGVYIYRCSTASNREILRFRVT